MSSTDGLLIALEGIDGSGKSAVIEQLKQHREDVLYTKEPTDSWIGNTATQCTNYDETHPLTDLYALCTDRSHHLDQTIFPALEQGQTIVTDRYSDSTRAYQTVALAQYFEEPAVIVDSLLAQFPEPDITLYLDCSLETAADRMSGDGAYEQREYLEQVQAQYDALCDEESRFIRVDADRSLDEVTGGVKNLIELAEDGTL